MQRLAKNEERKSEVIHFRITESIFLKIKALKLNISSILRTILNPNLFTLLLEKKIDPDKILGIFLNDLYFSLKKDNVPNYIQKYWDFVVQRCR